VPSLCPIHGTPLVLMSLLIGLAFAPWHIVRVERDRNRSGINDAAHVPQRAFAAVLSVALFNARMDETARTGAMAQALATVDPAGVVQRDVWHVLHQCGQVQGRLERRAVDLEERAATVARQAARVAAGQRPRGHQARTDVAAHAAATVQARRAADNVGYLTAELRALLEVVVVASGDVLDCAGRQREADALLALVAEARDAAPDNSRREVERLHTALTRALPGLLAFAAPLDPLQQEVRARLGRDALTTLAWVWPRRALLGPTRTDLLALLPLPWQALATTLYDAWEAVVRASSAVETWHSVLRPHLAVHRTLPPGMLALLTVWHNHQVCPRGLHQDQSPLQRSGLLDAPTDWLLALGYPSTPDHGPTPAAPHVLRAA